MKCTLWTETLEFGSLKMANSWFALHGLAPHYFTVCTLILPLIHGLCALFRPLLTPVSATPSLPASQFTVCTSQFTRPRFMFLSAFWVSWRFLHSCFICQGHWLDACHMGSIWLYDAVWMRRLLQCLCVRASVSLMEGRESWSAESGLALSVSCLVTKIQPHLQSEKFPSPTKLLGNWFSEISHILSWAVLDPNSFLTKL